MADRICYEFPDYPSRPSAWAAFDFLVKKAAAKNRYALHAGLQD
jgi:hypothetical protein